MYMHVHNTVYTVHDKCVYASKVCSRKMDQFVKSASVLCMGGA